MNKVLYSNHHSRWCGYGKNMKRWKYWDNNKCPYCLTKTEDSVQLMSKCKEPEMKAYKYELYEHIYSWLKEQDIQQILLDMIMTTLFSQPIIIAQEYENYWSLPKAMYMN